MIIESTDYKATQIQGKQRICSFRGGNAIGEIPWIAFDEELITHDASNGNIYRNAVGGCTTSLTDPAKVLTLRNPLDDSVVGASTYQQVMVLLYSLGRQTQLERDVVI